MNGFEFNGESAPLCHLPFAVNRNYCSVNVLIWASDDAMQVSRLAKNESIFVHTAVFIAGILNHANVLIQLAIPVEQ